MATPFPIRKQQLAEYLNSLPPTAIAGDKQGSRSCVLAVAIQAITNRPVMIFTTTWIYCDQFHTWSIDLPHWALEFHYVAEACIDPLTVDLCVRILEMTCNDSIQSV